MADSLFQQLTNLFRSGPTLRRKVKSVDARVAIEKEQGGGARVVGHTNFPGHSSYVVGFPGVAPHERLARLQDFVEMDSMAEINAALDIYADETVAQDVHGRSFHVYSNNPKIKKQLEDLFYNRINVEFNLRPWVRNMAKYGDGFYFISVEEGQGVTSLVPMPVHDVLREEGYNGDPTAVRFRWNSMGNKIVENWECAHLRLLGSDTYLPYGASMLDGARKVWRQLVMLEDAMLVYRLSRSPERRVFYIDVGNIPTDEVPNYMEQAKSNLVSAGVSDKTNGRLDQRFAPLSILEDFYIPTRGADTGTRIDTLQAGANTGNIEDVEYLRKKLVGSLKVPRAYLGYEEGLGSRSSLAAEDIRFSRTVNMIQRTVISELNKVAMVHLFACGFREDDLINFSLHLSNPSTIAQQQKLELYRTRFEIAGTTPENFLSKKFVYRNILNMTEEEILNVKREILEEARESEAVEAAGMGAGGGEGEAEAGEEVTPEETPEAGGEEVETAGKFPREGDLLDEDDDEDGEERMFAPPDMRNQKSVKLAPGMKKYLKNRRRTLARRGDPFSYRETDKRNGLDDPFDKGSLNEQLQFEEFSEENMIIASPPQEKIPTITMQPACGINDLKELQKMEERFRIKRGSDASVASNLLTEAADIHPDDENVELESLDDADLYANLTVPSDEE